MEDRCHYKYKDLTRRGTEFDFKTLKGWLTAAWVFWDWAVMKWCLGYGIYCKRILITGLAAIFVFAGLYSLAAGPETIKYLNDDFVVPAEGNWKTSGFHPLYFSVITFATIGYGDFAPLGWLRWLAGIEGLLGLLLMAVFTVCYARKLIR